MSTDPLITLAEEPRQYVLSLELPGSARDHISLLVENGTISLFYAPPAAVSRLSSQRDASHTWKLPADVEAASIVADLRNGVLRVRLPRVSQSRSWWPR